MRASAWKISTFTALGLAGFLALHPLGPPDSKVGPAAKTTQKSGGILSWLSGGGYSPADESAPHTGTHLQQLRDARNANETCEALRVLALEATGDEEATSEIAARADATNVRGVRVCAITALEKVHSGAAKSFLGELVTDPDTYVRDGALHALAEKAKDDPDAKSMVLAAAHSEDRDTRIEAMLALGDAHVPEASALIQSALATETGDTQSRLLSALGETHDATAVTAITKMLDDGSSQTRQAALEALGSIGGDAAIKTLEDKLGTGSREDVFAAARALARTGDPGAKQALMDATKGDRRDAQLAALRALDQVDGSDVRDLMAKNLASSDPQVVQTSAQWFSIHNDRAAVSQIASLLKSGDSSSRPALLSTLASIGGDDARDAIAQVARVPGPDRISALNQLSGMPGGRDEARKIALRVAKEGGQDVGSAISLLGQDASQESREALVTIAKGGSGSAAQAMNALAQHGDPDAMRALSDLAKTAKTPELRGRALAMIAATGNPQNAQLLLGSTHDKDVEVRRAALMGLARVGGDRAERALIDATTDEDGSTKNAAIRALGTMHSPTAQQQLEKLAGGDGTTARTAFTSLASSAPDRAAKLADRIMATGDADMRQTILQSAAQFPNDVSRRISVTALRDTNESVVSSAVSNLENIGGQDAQQALLDLLGSDAPLTSKRAAADALQRGATETAQQHQSIIDKWRTPDSPSTGPGEADIESDEDLD
ncbi:MAG TPA: HEAT repeat domain-containing protein, partial [Polyangiaceae bacterium]